MNSLQIEVALAKYLDYRQHLIVPNVWWGLGFRHELDLLVLTKSGYVWEIEIKISKADLLADKNKKYGHYDNRIRKLYFAVPKKLMDIAVKEIPERAGLFEIDDLSSSWKRVTMERPAKINKNAIKLSKKEIKKLYELTAMRIWSLKEKLLQKYNNNLNSKKGIIKEINPLNSEIVHYSRDEVERLAETLSKQLRGQK